MLSKDIVADALALPDSAEEGHLREQVFAAAQSGDVDALETCISQGADVRFQDETSGRSPLMEAAAAGHVPIVERLLRSGAPWNAQDRLGNSAGDHAQSHAHDQVVQLLMDWACLAEAVLRTDDAPTALEGENLAYLQQKVAYSGDKLLDADGEAVMMGWEAPLMAAHANLICQNDGAAAGDILNVGFGLGLVDAAIQSYNPRSHTIIEAHPDVYQHMLAQGWGQKPNVRLLFGRWEDVLEQLESYDGVFFDTYAEHYDHMRGFHAVLPRILKRGGLYSFFNGLAPRCEFFHLVYCRIVQDDLEQLGFDVQFMELPVAVDDEAKWDPEWEGVKNRYWFQRTYRLPIVYWKDEEAAGKDEAT